MQPSHLGNFVIIDATPFGKNVRGFEKHISSIKSPILLLDRENGKEMPMTKQLADVYFQDTPNWQSLRMSTTSLYSSAFKEDGKFTAKLFNDLLRAVVKIPESHTITVFDACANVGSNTSFFSSMFNVIATEIDEQEFGRLKNNMRVFNSPFDVQLYQASCLDIIDDWIVNKKSHPVDIIFFDPPWGGPLYRVIKQDKLILGLDNRDTVEIIDTCIDYNLAYVYVMKHPYNTAIQSKHPHYTITIYNEKDNKLREFYRLTFWFDPSLGIKEKPSLLKDLIPQSHRQRGDRSDEKQKTETSDFTGEDIQVSFPAHYAIPLPTTQWEQYGRGKRQLPGDNFLPFDEDKPLSVLERELKAFKSMHFGQRKLLLTEILFYSLYGKKDTHVIYAGAAPGHHSIFMSKLFPSFHFDLVDPAPWNEEWVHQYSDLGKEYNAPVPFTNGEPKTYKISDKINVYHGFFTDELASYLGKKYRDRPVLFLSDIRDIGIESRSDDIHERDAIVHEEMEAQATWFKLINEARSENVYGMFKFKVTFGIPSTTYLAGTLYYQPWAPLLSPEMRLITNTTEKMTYDNDWIEQHLQWYNRVARNTLQTPPTSQMNGTFDALFEYDIIKLYLQRVLRVTPTPQQVFEKMMEITKMLHEVFPTSGEYNEKSRKFCIEAGYTVPFERRMKRIQQVIDKRRKYATPTILTDITAIPVELKKRDARDFSNLSFSQLVQFINHLREYEEPIHDYKHLYLYKGRLVAVDLVSSRVDNRRKLAAQALRVYEKANRSQGDPSLFDIMEKDVLTFELTCDLDTALAEALASVDDLQYDLSQAYGKMYGGLQLLKKETPSRYACPRNTFGTLYRDQRSRMMGLIQKITGNKNEEFVQSFYGGSGEDKSDFTLLINLQKVARHEVQSAYKYIAMKKMFGDAGVSLSSMTHMLDVGGGSGELSHEIKKEHPNMSVTNMDVKRWQTKEHKSAFEGVEYVFVDTTKFPFADASFDCISSIQVLHHIDDPYTMLEEITRCLKPDGYFFVREHDCGSLEDKLTCDLEHMLYDVTMDETYSAFYNYRAYFFSQESLQALLSSVGFVPIQIGKGEGKTNYSKSYYSLWQYKP